MISSATEQNPLHAFEAMIEFPVRRRMTHAFRQSIDLKFVSRPGISPLEQESNVYDRHGRRLATTRRGVLLSEEA